MDRDHQQPPDIDDEEFDDWAEERLADVEYDTELGKEMGKDAVRLARGEMSQEEFHEKYHEQVQAEFGLDDRPTKPEK
ncbi:4Fe-4S ferredoxin N-terminal domain-containing protein [Halomicrobium katesii]|uniref:4Fe-4S ferredoxin N-terminal domain-containing protein n=1 Tax=Halomicrobium katesii TaxID=437163 RepID=UPI00035D8DCC|nr:4Fe-4S ferredoxin N-terminal domain-containing protein [Halomicrobium katesii]